jgi:hypothetical protein
MVRNRHFCHVRLESVLGGSHGYPLIREPILLQRVVAELAGLAKER